MKYIFKSKKLIYGLILLVFIAGLLTVFFVLRKPKWNDTITVDNGDALNVLLENTDNKYSGFLWVDNLSYTTEEISFVIWPSDDRVTVPFSDSVVEKEVLFGDNPYSPSLIYISTEYTPEQKNILQESICSFLKGDFCRRSLELSKITVHTGEYVFSGIEDSVIRKSVLRDLYTMIKNRDEEGSIDATITESTFNSYILSRVLEAEAISSTQENTNILLSSAFEFPNPYLSKVLLLSDNDPVYAHIKEEICTKSMSAEETRDLSVISKLFLNDLCKEEYTVSSSDIDNSLAISWDDDLLLSESVRTNMYFSYIQGVLPELEELINSNISEFLKKGYVLGSNTPFCVPTKTVYCTENFIMDLILFLELGEYEEE